MQEGMDGDGWVRSYVDGDGCQRENAGMNVPVFGLRGGCPREGGGATCLGR